jgi:hypothetical protein
MPLSEAIADFRGRAFGNIAASAKLKKVKADNPKLGSFIDARRTAFAAKRLLNAIRAGHLRVHLSPSADDGDNSAAVDAASAGTAEILAHPLPLYVFDLLPCSHGIPLDRPGDIAWRSKPLLMAATNVDARLPARLAASTLVLSSSEYSLWVARWKRQRPIPSQKRSRAPARPRRGRPRLPLDGFILDAVRSGKWSRKQSAACLRALYVEANPALRPPSENTLRTRVGELAIEHDDEGLQPPKRAGFSNIRKRDASGKLL